MKMKRMRKKMMDSKSQCQSNETHRKKYRFNKMPILRKMKKKTTANQEPR